MTDEQFLKQQFGNTLHFRVPDNYFQTFNKELMERIAQLETAPQEDGNVLSDQASAEVKPLQPQQQSRTATVRRLRPLRWAAAACVIGAVLVAGSRFLLKQNGDVPAVAHVGQLAGGNTQPDAVDQAIDYYMIDENEAYDLLAEF